MPCQTQLLDELHVIYDIIAHCNISVMRMCLKSSITGQPVAIHGEIGIQYGALIANENWACDGLQILGKCQQSHKTPPGSTIVARPQEFPRYLLSDHWCNRPAAAIVVINQQCEWAPPLWGQESSIRGCIVWTLDLKPSIGTTLLLYLEGCICRFTTSGNELLRASIDRTVTHGMDSPILTLELSHTSRLIHLPLSNHLWTLVSVREMVIITFKVIVRSRWLIQWRSISTFDIDTDTTLPTSVQIYHWTSGYEHLHSELKQLSTLPCHLSSGRHQS